MTFKDLQKLVQSQASLEQNQLVTRLKDKQFWIWNIEQHKQEDIKTKGDCFFNHVIGLPRKDGIEKSIFDIPKLKRLGKVYDLAVMVKVVEGDTTAEDDNSNMGADMTDWTDLGIGRT